ncbi:MAG: DUF2164 domain-containing protein [marine benthic group bacterium]|jgi:uncharacterized protein (DUF2164 family)|nr:DUF2164 domain-containing protein [Gemmatimonadota bacterium]MCL7961942.1 DUF2164 domain-containing protein [Candidatus Carthagonibacter metallireducens]MCL7937782.1 DUF2164 domain-containing protein [Gemmatimonadota bacterium]MCL7956538.1 DUF2164 domain-containing protein [Gemmatimonadota bacterium]MCL7964566.1 DUF2164 domain-containing protein [Gemmatimonadota bacterium]
MALDLAEDRRARLVSDLQTFYRESFDEELSAFRSAQVLDFFLGALGPQVYNQAVQDARAFFQRKLEDLEGEVYEPDGL